MTDKEARSPLPDFKYNAEISRFKDEIDTANSRIDEVNGMSADELTDAAKEEYDRGIAFYKRRLGEIAVDGEDYEGEKAELEAENSSIKLLSGPEWKQKTIEGSKCRVRYYEEEKSDVEEKYYPVASPS